MLKSEIKTISELKTSGYQVLSVKDEMRKNLISKIKNNEVLFPDIIGYEKTVTPDICNAILSKHDFILLGLRGQAKTRILRYLPMFLDEWIPVIKGSEINDNPFHPISKYAKDLIDEHGDDTEIEWIHREQRYGEKLATPDVTIADLIGDVDPIKAASLRLHYADERVMHFGIIPRTNRGIFSINELPDLQPRIQVGLLNIMQEKDIQIRGFPVRIPLDVMIVYSANPEDYTNRGNIITPLRDRIDSQILTHYPGSIQEATKITDQEAWTDREFSIHIPHYFKEIIEQVAFEARTSEFVDQRSGVSARLAITFMENLISNVEQRMLLSDEKKGSTRFADLYAALTAVTGKIELVYEGEQEGLERVAQSLLGKAIKTIFTRYFPDAYGSRSDTEQDRSYYQDILNWFENGNQITITGEMSTNDFYQTLGQVRNLKKIALQHIQLENSKGKAETASAMEFVLEGLHYNSRISKDRLETQVSYSDMLGSMLGRQRQNFA